MLDNLKKYKVILASNSPRRKELLAGLGVEYEVRTLPDVDESYPETLRGADIPLYISREKADAYRDMMHPDELMITADTIVWLDGQVLGKPKNREEAMQMLRDMSGRTHEVFTGVCITTTEWQRSFAAATEVRFAKLSEEEIASTVEHLKAQGEPDYHREILQQQVATGTGSSSGIASTADDADDPLIWEAAEAVVAAGLGSTSMLQRRLKVGYARAGRIMDMLESKGVVGPQEGSRARDVLIDSVEDLEALRAFEEQDQEAAL